MSSAEFTEWMAFYQLEPFGEERADLRSAIVATTVANAHRGKHQRPYRVEEFMPRFERYPKSPEEMLAYVEMLNAAFGGKDLRKRG